MSSPGTSVDPIIDISEPAVVAGVTEIQAWKGRDVDLVCVVQNKPADTNVSDWLTDKLSCSCITLLESL